MNNGYESGQARPHKQTRKGVQPRPPKKLPVIGSGKGRPAKGYNRDTKEWAR